MRRAQGFFLTVCFFVCPLLFFTNLTRNPYVTQISLLNICLLAASCLFLLEGAWKGDLSFPRTALDWPLLSWLLVCLLSWGVAYLGHAPFFRPAMASEGAKALLFLVVNALCPFYLAAACLRRQGELPGIAPWAGFVLAWGLLWTAFPQMRGPAAGAEPWGHLWDGYGALLWAGGLSAALWLARRGAWSDYWHLALAAGFLGSVYGVLQYFNLEFIWPSALNPYGGRSVSTFGNPNFMSSYNVILLPGAVALFSQSRGPRRLAYGALALALEAALLSSLTRSSWLGAAVGVCLLCLSAEFRRAVREDPRPHGLLLIGGLALALLWPQSRILSAYTPSVLGRLAELGRAAREPGPYGPWHQRVLIWACAWLMGQENPLTGKGWGLFELFYPFYQGHILSLFELLRGLRTHANNAHNEILEVWSQTGILGLGVFLWLWTAFFASVRRLFLGRRPQDVFLAAAASGVGGMLADNLLNVSLHFAVPGFLFWWTAGIAAGGAAEGERPRAGKGLAWRSAAAAALALAAALSWLWVRVWFREVHYFAGFKLLRQGKLPGAVKELELSRSWGPREVNAVYELGNAYARSERHEAAERAYAEALRANAGYDEIYYNMGVLNSQRLKAPERAILFFEVARWINPLSKEVFQSLGSLLLQDPKRHLKRAIALMEAAVRLFPEHAPHWNNLGYLRTLAGDLEEAERAYTQALSLDPSLLVAEKNLLALSAQGRPRAAILSGLSELRELEARTARREVSEESLALAERVGRRFPQNPKARFILGSLLLARGRSAEAVGHLEWVVAREGGQVWARVNLGTAYLSLGRREEAARELRAALALDSNNPQALAGLKALGDL